LLKEGISVAMDGLNVQRGALSDCLGQSDGSVNASGSLSWTNLMR